MWIYTDWWTNIDPMGIRSVADLIRAQFWDKDVNFYSLQSWNMLNNINSSMTQTNMTDKLQWNAVSGADDKFTNTQERFWLSRFKIYLF